MRVVFGIGPFARSQRVTRILGMRGKVSLGLVGSVACSPSAIHGKAVASSVHSEVFLPHSCCLVLGHR